MGGIRTAHDEGEGDGRMGGARFRVPRLARPLAPCGSSRKRSPDPESLTPSQSEPHSPRNFQETHAHTHTRREVEEEKKGEAQSSPKQTVCMGWDIRTPPALALALEHLYAALGALARAALARAAPVPARQLS